MDTADAVIVGSGPNGLVAASLLARAGWDVVVLERSPSPGGAIASAELTVPGYVHDVYSAFYGLLHFSPVFYELELDKRLTWRGFDKPVAAALSPNETAVCYSDPNATAEALSKRVSSDGQGWLDMFSWWNKVGSKFLSMMLAPLPSLAPALRVVRGARHYGLFETAHMQLQPMDALARDRFEHPCAQALLACGASHSDVAVDMAGSGPASVILAMVAQQLGMPVPIGGAGRLAEVLAGIVTEAGGTIRTNTAATGVVVEKNKAVAVTLDGGEIRARRAILADTGPRALFGGLVDQSVLPTRYLSGIRRFRYGTGVFKVDLAIGGEVPWARPELNGCGVVHLTGDLREMSKAAFEARSGIIPSSPMLIVGQQSLADPTRAPKDCHTLWIETHVPPIPSESGSWALSKDQFLDVVLERLEAHAPGLKDKVVGSAVRTPQQLEDENPNLVGGDLGAGSSALDQQLVFRPVPGWFRYSTPVKGLYLCSASAHPGGGVHGMAGRNCAKRVLADRRRRRI